MVDSVLFPLSGRVIVDANGDPESGAKLEVFDAGTSNQQTVYSDSALSVAEDNPIVTNASGVVPVRYVGTTAYKVTFDDSADATLSNYDTWDNIKGAVDTSSFLTGTVEPSRAVINKTTTYTTVSGDLGKQVNADATGGSFTVSLLSAVTAADGGSFVIKHSGTDNEVTVSATGGQTIDDKTSKILQPLDSITVNSDGANWHIQSGYTHSSGIVTITFADPLPIDASYPEHTNFQTTLTADTTVSEPTNLRDGQHFTVTLIQDGSGGWTPTFNAAFVGDFAVDEDANAVTVLDCHVRDSGTPTIDTHMRNRTNYWVEYDLGVLATGATETQAHGLGQYPDMVLLYYECTTNDSPYVVGDRVTPHAYTRDAGGDVNSTVWFDDTNVNVQHGANAFTVHNATGEGLLMTAASWKAVIKVFRFL